MKMGGSLRAIAMAAAGMAAIASTPAFAQEEEASGNRDVILDTLVRLRHTIAPRTVYPGHGEPWEGGERMLDNIVKQW